MLPPQIKRKTPRQVHYICRYATHYLSLTKVNCDFNLVILEREGLDTPQFCIESLKTNLKPSEKKF